MSASEVTTCSVNHPSIIFLQPVPCFLPLSRVQSNQQSAPASAAVNLTKSPSNQFSPTRPFLFALMSYPINNQHPLLPRFKGACLMAPAIQGNPPPKPVVAVLRHLVAPFFPRWQIPDALESGELALRVHVLVASAVVGVGVS